MEEEEEEEGLPNPVRRKGARRNTAEAEEASHPPRAGPKVKHAGRGPKDGTSGRRERWATKDVKDVVAP